MNKIALLEAVAERWNREGISYAVAHGIGGYPNRVGRDLDVLFAAGQARRGIDSAHEVLEREGLVVVRPPRLWGERLVAAVLEPEADLLEVHAVDGISWGVAELVGDPQPSVRVGPFAVDPWVGFAKRVLLPVLAGDIPKVTAELAQYRLQTEEADAANRRLPALVGEPLAGTLTAVLSGSNQPALANLVPRLRRAVTRRAWLRPAAAARRVVSLTWRRARQPFSPCGPVVCLVGPPGVDRSAVQQALCGGDPLVFTRCIPARSGASRSAASTTAGHWWRLATYFGAAVARSVTDRLHSSRQRLVVYDGCALDLVVDPRRHGLRSATGARLCWQLLPKPDLVVVLDPTAPASSCREQGDSDPGAAGHHAAYQTALAEAAGLAVVGADTTMEELRKKTMKHIVEAFVRRNQAGRRP